MNAYAAAVFGRLRSIPLTFVGAIVLGCMEGYLTGYLPQNQYLPGLRLAVPREELAWRPTPGFRRLVALPVAW